MALILGLSVLEAQEVVEDYLIRTEISVVAVVPETRKLAVDAYARYGKSRHPAALNFGDCFSYACPRQARVPLLYKGDDFPQTDIKTA